MEKLIKELLEEEKIETVGAVALRACRLLRPYLLTRAGWGEESLARGTVFPFAVPYYSPAADTPGRNVSLYAAAKDYHLYFSALFSRLLPKLQKHYPNNKFAGFTDHSPLDEVNAAALAGIGVIGDSRMLVTEKFGAAVFLGEIITDAAIPTTPHPLEECLHCGACLAACPGGCLRFGDVCLSAVTQKKILTQREETLVANAALCWGCDVCTLVCPYFKKIPSPIAWFSENLTPILSAKQIESMSEEDFSARAYSWRGRSVVLRNLRLREKQGEQFSFVDYGRKDKI